MKVFLDECVDWRLPREIVGHEVKTARQRGWSSAKNGELLALASKEFEVFVTVDRNLSFQQRLPAFAIAVIVLRAKSNRPTSARLCRSSSRPSPPPSGAPSRMSEPDREAEERVARSER